ncbi:hypothetical protein [Rhodohalobacter sulfatireducens]|uniref:Uncharacterized protein n=1 Tax=Rhodohalobacter sulfatireducens TaxID=2911366 RepID=A0ABS9KDM6_9BACT|nr:hypothetical protein [Rhodohalobacter sulfatireducens]MCG2588962.1 hypothetical protein [Rhodohalobacter sulfatireducens]
MIFLFGTDRFVPADLLFMHVDLSIVPDKYLEFAEKYPIVINGNIKDIRKSTYGTHLLNKKDNWDGPVIVKSDHNCAGIPERTRGGIVGKIHDKVLKAIHRFNNEKSPLAIRTALDYKVYDHLSEVPRIYFHHPGLVIQKFLPEMEDELYCVHTLFFLGDQMSCARLKGEHPIVKDHTVTDIERTVDPHPDILSLREKLQFDYGKFDYVIYKKEPVLLDANKTVGWPPNISNNEDSMVRIKNRAVGLYTYF